MTWPLPSVTVTTAPGSAVPVTTLPLVGSTVGVGEMASMVVEAGALALPAASVATATITVPCAGGVAGVKLKTPSGPAVTLPITTPPAVKVTTEPASAVPVIGLPSVGLSTGAAGGVRSTAVVASALVLPAASVAVTCSTVPSAGGVAGVMV